MFLKKLMMFFSLCGILLGCSDQKDSSTDFNKNQNEIVSMEQKTTSKDFFYEKKVTGDSNRLSLQNGTGYAMIETYCKYIGKCIDSLNTIVEKKIDSLKQTDKFKTLMSEHIRKNDSLKQNGLLSSQPRFPNPEGFFRFLIIHKLLEKK